MYKLRKLDYIYATIPATAPSTRTGTPRDLALLSSELLSASPPAAGLVGAGALELVMFTVHAVGHPYPVLVIVVTPPPELVDVIVWSV